MEVREVNGYPMELLQPVIDLRNEIAEALQNDYFQEQGELVKTAFPENTDKHYIEQVKATYLWKGYYYHFSRKNHIIRSKSACPLSEEAHMNIYLFDDIKVPKRIQPEKDSLWVVRASHSIKYPVSTFDKDGNLLSAEFFYKEKNGDAKKISPKTMAMLWHLDQALGISDNDNDETKYRKYATTIRLLGKVFEEYARPEYALHVEDFNVI